MVIEFAGVGVIRNGSSILDDVSWRVDAADRWVILGPNGAGKTTLLGIAATQLHPTSGVVSILDTMLGLSDVFELRPRIGLASASLAARLPDDETALDVVRTGVYAMLGRWNESYEDIDSARALRLLDDWGAAHLAQRSFGTLSEGERKRVQIARALMPDPEVLLLDEPAAGLDLGGREDLVNRLAELALDTSAAAQVLVTHHVEEIPEGVTHALLLRAGRVVAGGPIGETLTSARLSETFGLDVELQTHSTPRGLRFTARHVG